MLLSSSKKNLVSYYHKSVDQFESLCEIEEGEGQNNEELPLDEDGEQPNDNEQSEDTLPGSETYVEENQDQSVTNGES